MRDALEDVSIYTYQHQDHSQSKAANNSLARKKTEQGYALLVSGMTPRMNSVQGLGLLHGIALPLGTAERAAVPQQDPPISVMR